MEGRPKIFGPKWDTLKKHRSKRKATCDMANGIKKDQWFIAKNCKHLRNERTYTARSQTTVLEQVTILKGERARKQIQFATILHLLQNGRPMLEYTTLHPLFYFLGLPKLPKKLTQRVVSGDGSDSMTKIIVNAVKDYGGIEVVDLGTRLVSFGAGKYVILWEGLCSLYAFILVFR